jgi:Tol biopolymer transport system component/mono/diheme cytochrome c family protein
VLVVAIAVVSTTLVFNQLQRVPAQSGPLAVLTHAPDAFKVAELPAIGPLPTDEQSLLAGRQLYVAQCVTCHGAQGDGKGEYALNAGAPSVSDLRTHMAPGVHSDGQIAAWISNGIPGTSMPGYGMVLSEADIVVLTAYLRTFAQTDALVGIDPGALATEQARPPTPTPIPEVDEPLPKVVFVRDNNLWYSAGDGAAPVALTSYDADWLVQFPAFSPDGARIAFLATDLSPDESEISLTLHTVRADGSDLQSVWQSNSEGARSPVWDTDGSGLFLTITREQTAADGSFQQQNTVVRFDLAQNTQTTLLENARDLALSPDGRTMAYVRVTSDGLALAWELADRDGQTVRTLMVPEQAEELATPRFSPDGRSLLVVVRGVFATGALPAERQAQQPTFAAWLSAWFAPPTAQAHGTPWEIWQLDLANEQLRRLTNLGEHELYMAFSPDGETILLLGLSGFYRLQSDGNALERIAAESGSGGLDWAVR